MAIKRLSNYGWPGNIRQLRNFIESSVLLNEGNTIKPDCRIEFSVKKNLVQKEVPFLKIKEDLISDFEKNYIIELLTKTGGNVSKGAEFSGLSRRNLIRKIEQYKIKPAEFKKFRK